MYLYEEWETCQRPPEYLYILYLCFSTCSQRDSRHLNHTDAVTVTTTDLADLRHLVTDAVAHPDGLCFSDLKVYQKEEYKFICCMSCVKKTNRHFPSGKFSFSFNSNPLSVYFSSRRSRSPKRRRYVCFCLKSLK